MEGGLDPMIKYLQDRKLFLGWPKYSKKSFWDYSKKIKRNNSNSIRWKGWILLRISKNGNLAVKGKYLFDQKLEFGQNILLIKVKKRNKFS